MWSYIILCIDVMKFSWNHEVQKNQEKIQQKKTHKTNNLHHHTKIEIWSKQTDTDTETQLHAKTLGNKIKNKQT